MLIMKLCSDTTRAAAYVEISWEASTGLYEKNNLVNMLDVLDAECTRAQSSSGAKYSLSEAKTDLVILGSKPSSQ